MHKQNKEEGYELASRIFCENGPKIMKFKIPVKGRKLVKVREMIFQNTDLS